MTEKAFASIRNYVTRFLCFYVIFFLSGCRVYEHSARYKHNFAESIDKSFTLSNKQGKLLTQTEEEKLLLLEEAHKNGIICITQDVLSIYINKAKNLLSVNYDVIGYSSQTIIELLKYLYLNEGWLLSEILHDNDERYVILATKPKKNLFITIMENKKEENIIRLQCVLGVK